MVARSSRFLKSFFAVLVLWCRASHSGATEVIPGDFAELAKRCAPEIHPETMIALVRSESGFDPLVIGVNGPAHEKIVSASAAQAEAKAKFLLAAGKSIDVGYGQINSKNFKRLGLSVADAFDPCRNLAAASRLLRTSYAQFLAAGQDPASALDAALSAYNTGDGASGISNGYVGIVHENSGVAYMVPAIGGIAAADQAARSVAPAQAQARKPAASWDVFGDASTTPTDLLTTPRDDAHAVGQPDPLPAVESNKSTNALGGPPGAVVLFADPDSPALRNKQLPN